MLFVLNISVKCKVAFVYMWMIYFGFSMGFSSEKLLITRTAAHLQIFSLGKWKWPSPLKTPTSGFGTCLISSWLYSRGSEKKQDLKKSIFKSSKRSKNIFCILIFHKKRRNPESTMFWKPHNFWVANGKLFQIWTFD